MAITLHPVTNSRSGNIQSAGYDGEILRVEFRGGKKYDYHGVTPELAQAFREAPSASEYLHKIIKPACPAAVVKPGE